MHSGELRVLTNPPHSPLRSGLCQLPSGNTDICKSKACNQGISWWRGSDARGNGCLSCFLIQGSSAFMWAFVSLPSGPVQPWPCLSQPLHHPPSPLAPCLPHPKASLSPSQNIRPPTSRTGLWGPLILSWTWKDPCWAGALLEPRGGWG